jgi:acetoin:2,6-dichlorophenolindophenol oxidoreductase subunit alpha
MLKIMPREDTEICGCATELVMPPGMSLDQVREIYYKMNLIRQFDTRVKDLWMDNKIYGLAHSYVGAEAIAVGACAALRPDDYITSTHRGHGHTIAKGANVNKMMAELFGKYEGYNRGKGGSMHIADVEHGMLGATGIVGSGMPIALGSALSADLLGNGKVTVCFHGDGGTNQGVWHETINMAAAWNLPVIFLIENNQMAIGTELKCVCKETDLYKRASGYGIPGVLVDGFNVFDVFAAVREAVDRARSGGGPTLIEARFLRLLGHFVADDQWYRDMSKVDPFWEQDPIKRLKQYLQEKHLLADDELLQIETRAKEDVGRAVDYATNECTEPDIRTLYEDVYAHGEVIV